MVYGFWSSTLGRFIVLYFYCIISRTCNQTIYDIWMSLTAG
jgi:hypothetical protein